MKTDKSKELLLEQLKKTPIVETACQKLNIGRSTYYYWRNEDPEFAKLADEAIWAGSLLVSDLAESQLIAAIKDRDMRGIIFWLKTHHPTYATKLQIEHEIKDETMNEEQAEIYRKAMSLLSGKKLEEINNINNQNENEQKQLPTQPEHRSDNSPGVSGGDDQGQKGQNSSDQK